MTIRWVICLVALVLFIGAGVFYDFDTGFDSSGVVSVGAEEVQEIDVKVVSKGSKIEHVVLCWLKDKNVEEMAAVLLEKSQRLRSIPGVTSFRSGNVVQSTRDIVDDSFHVGFVMGFDSKEALDGYLSHPTHVSFVKDVLGPVMDKVVVYDIQMK